MYAKNVAFPVLAPATLLALIAALFFFSQAASAEPRPGEDPGAGPGVRGGVVGVPVLPGEPEGEPPAQEQQDAPPAQEEAAPPEQEEQDPSSKRLALTIPKLGMKNVSLGDSPDQAVLDREGIIHLGGTDFPWQDDSNTYIVGHAIGYPGGRIPEAFRHLADLRDGDRVTLRDADGEKYRYRVYKRLLVDPTDIWVTEPVEGKDNIVSLQTCYPEPTFEKRLVVRAELIEEGKGNSADSGG
jgi:sortase A